METKIILTDEDIRLKIKRIAHQIHEANIDRNVIYIAGIANSGYNISQLIKAELEKISPIEVRLGKLRIKKTDLFAPFEFSYPLDELKDNHLVIVDDVLNSGGVLIYAVKYFLDIPLKSIKTAVLVDRNHKKYPIKVDYKGLSLSTSLQNRVSVVFDPSGDIRAELS